MKRLIFVGDIHGELKKLIWILVEKFKIKDANVVVAGDFGVGFIKRKGLDNLYENVKNKLDKNNINLYTIRGNHDDPEYFDGEHNYNRLVFLQDYIPIELSGKVVLPIGGAVSIDQKERIDLNKKYEFYKSSKRVWWENEDVTRLKNLDNLARKVDIVVSHEAPISFEPIIVRRDINVELDVWNKILESRRYLEFLKSNINFDIWIHGHYHKSSSGIVEKGLYRGLNIEELFEIYNDVN